MLKHQKVDLGIRDVSGELVCTFISNAMVLSISNEGTPEEVVDAGRRSERYVDEVFAVRDAVHREYSGKHFTNTEDLYRFKLFVENKVVIAIAKKLIELSERDDFNESK